MKILGPNADYTLFSKEMLEQLSRVRHDPSFVPTSFGVSSKRICRVCEKIGTVLEILQCVRCKRAYYCGVECQAKDFPSHKETCIRACFTCEKIPDDIMVCTACNDAVYCNAECQLVDWSRHKSECSNPETLVSVLNPVA